MDIAKGAITIQCQGAVANPADQGGGEGVTVFVCVVGHYAGRGVGGQGGPFIQGVGIIDRDRGKFDLVGIIN